MRLTRFVLLSVLIAILGLTPTHIRAAEVADGMRITFTNSTNGKFADDSVYWAVIGLDEQKRMCHLAPDGTLVPNAESDNAAENKLTKNGVDYANYFTSLAEAKSVPLPRMSAARIFLSVGSPMYLRVIGEGYAGADVANPTDPNADVYFDFVEFTYDALGWHGNTTQVDQFGFPLVIEIAGRDGTSRKAGITKSRTAIFEAFAKDAPAAFKGCVKSPYRIVSPCAADFRTGASNGTYFDAYLTDVWAKFANPTQLAGGWTGHVVDGALTFTDASGKTITCPQKPTSEEALLGGGILGQAPKFCAAINRRVLDEPADWNTPAKYYAAEPYNFYAQFWHEQSIDGKAYGFCYDDVNDQSSYIEHRDPTSLNISISWD